MTSDHRHSDTSCYLASSAENPAGSVSSGRRDWRIKKILLASLTNFQLGADIIGVNCKFDPFTSMETIRLMKEALDKEGLNPYMMIQPVGYHTPDAGRAGFSSLPELPFGKS